MIENFKNINHDFQKKSFKFCQPQNNLKFQMKIILPNSETKAAKATVPGLSTTQLSVTYLQTSLKNQ